ncbi:hypothetical protein PRUPE_4G205900 [Prunus persica]|uniref:START domain-containing protein n=1 Tax=Prunus persica TaxID=3760 RepID=A0A251PQ09_PRUPE|nr:hypothetical protein PRUPE_4G205900 [Prunus persica]
MNYSENFDGETSNHELQHVEKFVGVSAASGSAINKIQLYCESGVELWVDLKMDSNPQYNSDHMHMPRLTAFPQGSSPQVPLSDFGSQTFGGINNKRASDLLISMSAGTEINRLRISELASKAMEELVKLAFAREPLWKVDTASNTEILSEIEYMREFGDMNATLLEIVKMVEVRESQSLPSLDMNNSEFSIGSQYKPKELGPKPVSSEASREIGLVRMNPSSIVQLLMNLRQWSQAFSNIVSRAAIVGVLSSTGVQGNYDGTLQVMTAEFHAPTPLVPTRESYFARYCKKLGSDTWAVVDVSLEKLFQFPSRNFRRQPSGCLVQEMPDGWSNVIWVEHVEVDNSLVHNMFEPLVSSGFAFCAKRWVATLIRQCQWLETTMARRTCFSTDGGFISQQGRRTLLKLSERMVRSFFRENTSACSENKWMSLPWPTSGAENIRISMKSSTGDPGRPPGTTMVFATSIYHPFSRKKVFSFLRDEKCRSEWWDMLAFQHEFHEYAYFTIGENPGNRVSILRSMNDKTKEVEIFYLQASYTDSMESYVVYAPIDAYAMTDLINGGNPDYVAILPSGFSILPDKPMHQDETGGSLLTIAFHIALGASTEEHMSPHQHLNVGHKILETTLSLIKEGLEFMI